MRRLQMYSSIVLENPGSLGLRPVLWIFYTLETFCNMFCFAFHVKGFMAVNLDMLPLMRNVLHHIYLAVMFAFTVQTFWLSINISTGHKPVMWLEIWSASLAAICFLIISIMSVVNAERDIYIMYESRSLRKGKYQKDEPVHLFNFYLLVQSISGLFSGLIYLLHATILIDIKVTGDEDELLPIHLSVFGGYIQQRLEQYRWFRQLCNSSAIKI